MENVSDSEQSTLENTPTEQWENAGLLMKNVRIRDTPGIAKAQVSVGRGQWDACLLRGRVGVGRAKRMVRKPMRTQCVTRVFDDPASRLRRFYDTRVSVVPPRSLRPFRRSVFGLNVF